MDALFVIRSAKVLSGSERQSINVDLGQNEGNKYTYF